MTWVISIALNNKNGKKTLRILKLRKRYRFFSVLGVTSVKIEQLKVASETGELNVLL